MPGTPAASKRLRALGTASLLLGLFNRKYYRWFTAVSLLSFGAAWLWARKVRLRPPLALLQDSLLPEPLGVVEVGAYDPVWLVQLGRKLAPRRVHVISGLVPAGPQTWLKRMEASARQAGLLETVTPLVADAGHLPLADDQATVVVLHDLFGRLPDRESRQQAIAEAVRVLAPGGRLIVGEPRHAGEAAAAMADQGLGVRQAADGDGQWLVATKPWS